MAQYWFEASDPDILNKLEAHPANIGGSISVEMDGGAPAILVAVTSNFTATAYLFTGIEATDVEMFSVMRTGGTGNASHGGLILRCDPVQHNFYGISLRSVDRSQITRHDLGSFSTLSELRYLIGSHDVYHARRGGITGSTLKTKAWELGADEPQNWSHSTTDTTYPAAGGVGLVATYTASQSMFYRAIGIGTNGDPAPAKPIVRQLFRDFEVPVQAGVPQGFELITGVTTTFEVVADATATNGKALKINGGYGSDVIRDTELTPNGELEFVARLRKLATGSADFGLGFGEQHTANRLQYDFSPQNGIRIRNSGLGGDSANLITVTTFDPGTDWYRVRGYRNNATGEVKVRMWRDADPEPATWDIETNFANTTLTKFVIFEYSARDVHIDWIGLGGAGAEAPSNAPTHAPTTPINLGVTNLQAISARLTWEQG